MTTHVPCVLMLLMAAQGPAPPRDDNDCGTRQPARVWSPVVPAVVKTQAEPSWPARGRNDSQEVIILDVWIDERGAVTCVKVLRSSRLNEQAAVDAVRRWTFVPATISGRPVAVVQQVLIKKQFS
jgi:TonB family protein